MTIIYGPSCEPPEPPSLMLRECPDCKGVGLKLIPNPDMGAPWMKHGDDPCPRCEGLGDIYEYELTRDEMEALHGDD